MHRVYWGARLGWASAAKPKRALALMLGLAAAMAPGLFRLELRTDGHSLVPPDDPAIAIDARVRERFGLRDPLLVVVESRREEGIFNAETLGLVAALTRELAALPGLSPGDVQSLATESSGRFAADGSSFRPLLEPPLDRAARLAEVREDVEAIDILNGTIVSRDRKATAILVGVPAPSDSRRGSTLDRVALYHRVTALAGSRATERDRISVVGAPAAEALLGEHVLADLALLVPLALLVIAAVLWLVCGRAWAALLGMAKIGAAQVFTLGLMGWCGQPVYLTTAMIPVLLTTIGLAGEIHLLWHYRHRDPSEPAREALHRIFGELARPMVLTTVTTAIGFLAFLTSTILPVSRFGLFTALGVLFCLLWSLMATPALLALRPEAIPAAGPATKPRRLADLALGLASRPGVALPVLALLTALLALGATRLEIQDSWLDNFAPKSRLRQDTERADRLFSGTHVLLAEVTFDTPDAESPSTPIARGPLLAGSAVEALGRFEAGLRAMPEVGTALGLHSHLLTTAYLWGGRREFARSIMDNPSWIYLHVRRIGNVRGDARRIELVDDAFRHTVVTVLLERANFQKTAKVIDGIRRLERKELAPARAHVDLAGDLAISQAMIPGIVRTQVGSLLGALAANVLILTLLCRSFRLGLACAAPTTVAVAWTFGLMGWIGLPLGVATSIFCAVTLGIGDDYCIHLLERYRAAVEAGTANPARAAVAAAGPAVIADALAIILGFGLLVFSQVPTNRWLGLLVVFGLASACLITIVGAGGILALLDRRRARSAVSPALARAEAGERA